ncbi:uncharacterized protein [Choristoneura fumiferana]|uniref:uncharacterized protein n=1 Tax=Choristoneura fumiferana TaxID=7141 RepID=UPI003D157CF5
MTGPASSSNLQLFMDKFVTAANAIKHLNLNDLADYMLLHTALKKLDDETVLAFEMKYRDVKMPTFGGAEKSIKGTADFKIYSRFNENTSFDVSGLVVDRITDNLPTVPVNVSMLSHISSLPLADESFASPASVDVLLGASIFPHLLLPNMVHSSVPDIPPAIQTVLGYIMMGSVPAVVQAPYKYKFTTACCAVVHESPLDQVLKKFWELEEVTAPPAHSRDDLELHQLIADDGDQFPIAATIASTSTYMDDVCFSIMADDSATNDETVAIAASKELIKLFKRDEDGLIRVGGRLTNAKIDYAQKHPFVFPRRDHVVDMVVDYYHKKHLHAGPELLMSLLRCQYWILAARRVIRHRIHNCNTCFRAKPRPSLPLMADLPDCRVNQAVKPFTHTGCDYAGPIQYTPVVGQQILSYEELLTVLAQVEALVNSRPLTAMSSDPAEPAALTPAHFLHTAPLLSLPTPGETNGLRPTGLFWSAPSLDAGPWTLDIVHWELRKDPQECDSVNAVTDCKTDLKLWHERLGHLNAKDVIKLLGKIGLAVNSSGINRENVEETQDLELNPDQECEVVVRRGSGRPKVIRTGRPGRPRKVYNYVEVEERNSESEAEEYSDCIDYAGAASEISLNDALRSSERSEWEAAILSEIRSLVQKGTWTIVKTPPNTNVVGCRYVLTTKINVDKTTKKKARLVAQGFSQRFGVDYEKTFAPVARLETVRLMMAIAVEMDLEIHQVDINTAYLNGNLDEQIYMRIPRLLEECLLKLAHDNDEDPVVVKNAKEMLEGLKTGGDTCLLKKSLYGLKQAGRQWNIRFDKKLKEMGLEQSLNEPCLYMRHQDGKYLFVLVFVDDVLIASDCEGRICRFKDELKKEFDLKDYGKVKYFLGIDIKKNENGITLSQEGYVKTILEKFCLSNCNSCKTPSELSDIFSSETKKDKVEEKWPYRELIGSLMYLSVATRPDITNTVVKLAQFVSNPNLSHWKAAKRVLRYLKGTANYGLNYRKTGGASISWSSRKQKTVATSSCEAEYVSLAEAFKEGLYLQSLLTEMKLPGYATISIYTDSQSAMFLAQDPVFHGRSKHIDIKYHFIRGVLKDNNNIMLGHVPTESMLADVLTKALPSIKHNRCLNGLGLKPC